ncbi:restriction endonuclease subunit S [Aliivibrio fischeri]|uniref:restriction endonuclease subunit S n=1 Tax=Aliivibrio fischeri TaxID=668 RepID=UPI0012D9BBA4|nr:restriction endonuclease subunit S [Aliivibrio fischeri]MUK38339.1 restriction endonuclease subunit S [Aliivibrio fischeri]MUL04928.1 restriction endonuclease subunit S [Aliivibrio fischeri]
MVPNGWKKSTAGSIAKVTSGGTPSRKNDSYWNGDIPWVTTSEVKFGVIADTEQKITKQGLDNSSAKLFPKDTILMAMYGQGKTRGQVAKLGIEASTNQACAALLLNKEHDVEYYYQYLMSQYDNIRELANSGGQQNLSAGIIKDISVPVPPLPEQRKIAQILSTWDKAISTTEKLIDTSKQQKKALMQQLLTGKKRLVDPETGKAFEGEWEEERLSALSIKGKGNFTDGDWIESPYIADSGCRLIQTGNIGVGCFKNKAKKYISEASFVELKCKEVKVNDLLICRLAEPAGRACVVPDIGERKMLTSVDVTIMRVDKTKSSPEYLSYFFSLDHTLYTVTTLCGGSTRSRISRTNLGQIKILLPALNEQQKIASVLTAADKDIELLVAKLAHLKQEKKALMQQLLTGKRRVQVAETEAA